MKKNIIDLHDRSQQFDAFAKGIVSCTDNTDSTERTVFDGRPNLIVQGGRLFNLLKCFNLPMNSITAVTGSNPLASMGASAPASSAVLMWRLGKGGAYSNPVAASGVTPPTGVSILSPKASDKELYTPVVFKSGFTEVERTTRGYLATAAAPTEALWKKIAAPTVVFDGEAFNSIYVNMFLQLEADEVPVRGTVNNFVNELGLYIGILDGSSRVTFSALFSRLIFPAEYLLHSKRLRFNYKVFA